MRALMVRRADSSAGAGYDQVVRIVARHRRHSSDATLPPPNLFHASIAEKTAEAVVCFITRRPGFQLAAPAPARPWWRFSCLRRDAFDMRDPL